MTVSDNLQAFFDKKRNPHLERLEFLMSMGLDPEFAERCALMFEQINATTQEIMNQKKVLFSVDDKLHKLELKRNRLHRMEVLKHTN